MFNHRINKKENLYTVKDFGVPPPTLQNKGDYFEGGTQADN